MGGPFYTRGIDSRIRDMSQDIHTSIPGMITSYDPKLCEASIKPYGTYRRPGRNAPNQKGLDYPEIHHVPVFFIQSTGQKAAIVHPVMPGDECLLIFSEQSLDTWRDKAETDTDLRHHLTNAVALTGLFARPNPLAATAQENESIIIQRDETFIQLYEDKLEAVVKNSDFEPAYSLMINGTTSGLELSVKDLDKGTESINLAINGNDGTIKLAAANTERDIETVKIQIGGQNGTLDLITKSPRTGAETAYIKMNGAGGTIDIQGYVTIKGSLDVEEKVIQGL